MARSGPRTCAPDEADALRIPCDYEAALARSEPLTPSRFFEALTDAVVESGRWQKWLQPDEPDDFDALTPERRH